MMKIHVLSMILAAAAASCAPTHRQSDDRIVGTWKSNRELTVPTLQLKPGVKPDTARKLNGLFGRLTITYSDSMLKAQLPPHGDAAPFVYETGYTIVGHDGSSVTIRAKDSLDGKVKTTKLTFVGPDRYWIPLHPITGREYFDRVE